MKSYSSTRQYILTFAVTVSSLALLAGCSGFSDFKRQFTGKRPSQVVDGPRRSPVLNPLVTGEVPETAEQAPMAIEQQSAPQASIETNPYDTYDAQGQPVGPKSTASAPQENFFSRMFSSDKKSSDGVRKPLPGNPYYSDKDTGTAMQPVAPQSSVTPVPANPAPVFSQVPMTSQEMTDLPPEPQVAESASQPAQGSWLSRMVKSVKKPFASEPDAPPPASADTNVPTPHLSSVPPVPEEFQAIKAERQQQMEELQSEHMSAQSEKQSLASEPSQTEASKPVEAAKEKTVPTVKVPAPKPIQEGKPIPGGNDAVLLGHVADPAMETTSPAVPVEEPVKAAAAEPAPPAEEKTVRQPYFWEGWKASDKSNPAPAAQPPAPVQAATPPAAVQPLVEPAVEEVSAEGEKEEEQKADSALPSPSILQQMKMLPPSRYSGRVQTYQYPVQEQ